MSTTAEEPATDAPATDPTIDVELPTSSAQADESVDVPTTEAPVEQAAEPETVPTSEPWAVAPATRQATGPSAQPVRSAPRRNGSRRTRVTVRRFGLLSVFKFALIFSVCLMVVLWLALMLIFFVLQAAGVTDTIAYWIGCVIQAPEGTKQCVASGIDAFKLFTYLFFAGLVMAAASAVLWTFVALIYNLISDIVGGVEVVLAEKRR
jgi:transmembrane protein DUF3566